MLVVAFSCWRKNEPAHVRLAQASKVSERTVKRVFVSV